MSFWQFWERYGRFAALGIGIGLVILGVYISLGQKKEPEIEFFEIKEEESREIIVDLSGAVKKPGVYRLNSEERINKLIELGGGFSEKADLDWISRNLNLARKLNDGEKIYIPEKGEASFQGEIIGAETSDLININSGTQKELEALPGIGPSFAQRIIEYRTSHGGFKSIEEIKAVPGIGEKTFEKIKDRIRI